ncbi:uncharacterized protein F5147DRAFT_401102 [Suillus discolor]|uniref:Uncharacterized protein n=1 Tax=Suillus discolor TaxID=1912936 RepID=A0A9P7EWZ7_9AGAM|nr:uncharacterized protein F5147DRAFT_401102 [Suillus discolor]KAG2095460.1 hypothetical protein F5147DRAFT_401102 [Suillus discolor]
MRTHQVLSNHATLVSSDSSSINTAPVHHSAKSAAHSFLLSQLWVLLLQLQVVRSGPYATTESYLSFLAIGHLHFEIRLPFNAIRGFGVSHATLPVRATSGIVVIVSDQSGEGPRDETYWPGHTRSAGASSKSQLSRVTLSDTSCGPGAWCMDVALLVSLMGTVFFSLDTGFAAGGLIRRSFLASTFCLLPSSRTAWWHNEEP